MKARNRNELEIAKLQSEAQKSGMSYGQYVASKYVNNVPPIKRFCKSCGRRLINNICRNIYCDKYQFAGTEQEIT